jgi:hypothetical protein
MTNRARTLLQRAEADSAAYLPGATGNEAERARMLYQIGCLRSAVELLCDEAEAPAPKLPNVEAATVTVDGVEVTAHFTYTKACRGGLYEPPHDEHIELHDLFIGAQNVNALLDGERDDAITEALLAHVHAAGVVARLDLALALRAEV